MNHNCVKDYLEISYKNNKIICNFTEEVIGKHVNITQSSLKGGNTKIVETDKFERKTCNNHNKTEIKEKEKIYNYHNRLIFEYRRIKCKLPHNLSIPPIWVYKPQRLHLELRRPRRMWLHIH